MEDPRTDYVFTLINFYEENTCLHDVSRTEYKKSLKTCVGAANLKRYCRSQVSNGVHCIRIQQSTDQCHKTPHRPHRRHTDPKYRYGSELVLGTVSVRLRQHVKYVC